MVSLQWTGFLFDLLKNYKFNFVSCGEGGIALDPKHFETNNVTILEEAWALHNSCRSVGEVVSRLNPDVVFISTPHGIADLNSFLFYLNDRGYGRGDTDNCYCPPCCYNVSVALDFELSMKLILRLKVQYLVTEPIFFRSRLV